MKPALRLSWAEREGTECLRVQGCSPDELALLKTNAAEALALLPADIASESSLADLQPAAGAFFVEGGDLWFRPRFPFRPGLHYALLIARDGGSWHAPDAERCEVVHPENAACQRIAFVTAIHPTAAVVPLNLLKFYIEFSAPMSEGYAAKAISLRRHDGALLDSPFAPMDPELWDAGRRRLTILLDPARIKRGLAPHEEAGYPLLAGEHITLRIDNSFRDAAGNQLAALAERRYAVAPALRELVKPRTWGIELPPRDSVLPLVLRFGRPLDHALLRHCISVRDAEGLAVAGHAAPDDGDESWRFTPSQPWRHGRYRLDVDPRLEDLAGNSVHRLFDHDLSSDARGEPGAATVPWEIA